MNTGFFNSSRRAGRSFISTSFFAKLLLLLVAAAWGSSLVVVKGTTDMLSPFYLLALRFTIGWGTLCLLFRKRLAGVTGDDWKRGSVIGVFLFLAYSAQTVGVMLSMPGKSAFLSSIYCVMVPFLYWAIDHQRPDAYTIGASVLCVAGIGFTTLQASLSLQAGDSLAILSGFFFAAHIVAVAKCGKDKDPIVMTVLQFGICAVLCWGSSFLLEGPPSPIEPAAAAGILYLGFVCTSFALLLQNIGQKYAEPSSAAIILSLESIFGIVFSVCFFQEELTASLLLGFGLIFSAILLSETKLSFRREK